MSRHRRCRPWQQIALCTGGAVLGVIATIGVTVWAYRAPNVALYMGDATLGLGTAYLILISGSWIAATGWYAGRARFLDAAVKRYTPPNPPLNTEPEDDGQAAPEPDAIVEPDPADVTAADHWCWEDPTLPHPRPATAAYNPRPWMPPVSASVGANGTAAQETPF